MSEPDRPARPTPDDLSPGADPGARPLAEALSALGTGELLKRLDEHRARVPRHSGRQHLASGGMGEVHRVRDEDLGRDLAMKVLRRDFEALDEEDRQRMLARFLEEAQVTGQLHHPAIVPVYELSIDAQGQPYFTMPLIRGRDFGEVIRLVREGRDGWTLARALGIVLKVCEAVAYAHARGVIHRDLKPSNVRVGRFGETYVMDWGLARVLGRADARDLRLRDPALSRSSAVRTERSKLKTEEPDSPLITMDGQVVGTPQFMSPEQARGETARIGPRSDVYAVGAMLYHLLSGRAPYQPAEGVLSARAVWSLVLDGPPRDLAELAPDAPEELVDICRKAMERIPEKRYADTQEMALDIEAFLDRRPVKAHAPTVGYALKLAYERNRRSVAIASAIALPLLGVLGFAWWDMREARAAEGRTRRMSEDTLLARALRRDVGELYPATPRELVRFDRWIASADDLLSRRPAYERALQDVSTAQGAAGVLGDLCTALGALREDRERVLARRRVANDLDRLSVKEPADLWSSLRADVRDSQRYGQLVIEAQVGLVPLWKNQAGLWEFWHIPSGNRPAGSTARTWKPRPEDGIVLILVPGGRSSTGSTPEDIEAALAEPNETLTEADLKPFFAAKTEVTQGQWLRTMGSNPARLCPEDNSRGSFSLSHPVESITWDDATEFCRRLGLRLLQESEWEYVCRAGGNSRYGWGQDLDSLREHENVLDQSAQIRIQQRLPWDDGFAFHAPVGSFPANAFGFVDMLGNVSEWCADELVTDLLGRPAPESAVCVRTRAIRGGNWYLGLEDSSSPLRCAYRQWDSPRSMNHARGMRVARSVE